MEVAAAASLDSLTIMGLLHEVIIRFFLNLERVCLEICGNGLVVEDQGSRCSRFTFSLVGLLVFLCVITYYGLHFYLNESVENDRDVYEIQYIVDGITAFTLLTFPFAGPLHRALGYHNVALENPLLFQNRLNAIYGDRGTQQAINLALICMVSYTLGEGMFFANEMEGAIVKLLYVLLILANIALFYGAMLMIILSMRIILVRLYQIEEQVDEALIRSDPPLSEDYLTFYHQGNGSGSGIQQQSNDYSNPPQQEQDATDEEALIEPSQQVFYWTNQYRGIRRDVHNLSQYFGFRMLAGIFLFTLDTTTLIAGVWEEVGETLGTLGTFCLLLSYVPNAIMITGAIFSAAYLVMECAHHVGPKLAILAVRMHSDSPEYQVLASAFLHAPVKIHVGVFEVAPEYANALGLWFLGLFLVVFGLKAPGEV